MKIFRNLLLLSLAMLAVACVNDDKPVVPVPDPPDPVSPVDSTHTVIAVPANAHEWIYKYLVEWYLWPQDILSMDEYNAALPWDEFFYSMLSTDRLDGKTYNGEHHFFSNIIRDEITGGRAIGAASRAGIRTGEHRTGFDFFPASIKTTGKRYFVVDYVDPASNAYTGGLRRGAFISAIDGADLTSMSDQEYAAAYLGMYPPSMGGTLAASGMTLRVAYLDTDGKMQAASDIPFTTETTDENPILIAKTLRASDGAQVGYLHYLSFKTGYPDVEDITYHGELKRKLRDFKAAGVEEVVLDLRFNGGGVVATSQLLTSMLAPGDKAGRVFAHNTYNANITRNYYPEGTTSLFLSQSEMVDQPGDQEHFGIEAGTNLGLSRLYVIVSDRTASASELLINALLGVDVPVHLIGRTTVGKTVGMPILRDGWNGAEGGIYTEGGTKWRYTMMPVGFSSTNAKGTADYQNGFAPACSLDESKDLATIAGWKELGDPQELLLSAALEHIVTGEWPAAQRAGRSAVGSIDRREIPGIRRDRGSLLILPSPDGATSR